MLPVSQSLALSVLLAAGFASAQNLATGSRRSPHIGLERGISPATIDSFIGTNQDSIQAAAVDSSGNVYVAGTTYSGVFPVKNAEQPVFGESSILQTTDLGATWSRVGNPPGGATSVVVDPAAPQVLFATNANGIYRSADSGQTWAPIYPGVVSALAIDPGNHLHLAALTGQAALARSLDGGQTWSMGGSCGNSCSGKLLADPAGSGTLLAGNLSLAISRDWGVTFQSLGPPGGVGPPIAAAFDPTHPGWIYVDKSAGVMGTLYLTTDYGSTWSQKASPASTFSEIIGMAVDPDQPNLLVAATPSGLYESSDGASSWAPPASSSAIASDYFLPELTLPFALVANSCHAGGDLFALGAANAGSFSVAFSPDFGSTWMPPQLTHVSSFAAGAGCTFYVTRTLTSDAFVAKIAPNGATLWSTFLGGSDRDAPVGLAVDAQGNVYVAGNTSSPDFPASVPHIGPHGENSVFLSRFSPTGALTYSATLGGEAANSLVALAVDASQNAYLAGTTDSLQFPVTAGTVAGSLDQGSYTGFLAKLSANGALSYATYLGASYTYPSAILVDANQEVTIAGTGTVPGLPAAPAGEIPLFVMKLDRAAAQVLTYAYLPAAASGGSVTGMATDSQSNLILFGGTYSNALEATAGAYSGQSLAQGPCNPNLEYTGPDDAFVLKLSAANWATAYIAVFSAACGIETGAIAIDGTGAAVLAMGASSGLSLSGPMMGGPACSPFSTALAKLSGDGSTLEYATYLPNCGVPAIALASDGTVFAGVAPLPYRNAISVLHLDAASSGSILLNQISNAFGGDESVVVAGGLYSLAVSGFQPATVNLGLNPARSLPSELGGVEVLFDGTPASILATSPGLIVIAAPPALPADARTGGIWDNSIGMGALTSIQVVYNGVTSTPVWMPISESRPGLLTVDFPNLMAYPGYEYGDAIALNQDGMQNSAARPAAAGSTITLFATGLGPTAPLVAPGSISTSTSISPVTPVYSSWERSGPGSLAAPLAVSSAPGFISSVFQIQAPVPANIASLFGTNLSNGEMRAEIGLLLNVPIASIGVIVSNIVGLYVQ